LRTFTVLLASSDSHERKMWTAHLANLDYRIELVENGEAALRTILASRIDAVVAAVTMEKLDGLELLRALGGLARPPVTLLVAQGGSEIDKVYLKIAKLYGAAEVYTQPLDRKAFRQGLRDALGLREPTPKRG
jgi:DNA-binding response OmpR family regulator